MLFQISLTQKACKHHTGLQAKGREGTLPHHSRGPAHAAAVHAHACGLAVAHCERKRENDAFESCGK